MRRRTAALVVLACTAVGVGILLYRGPGRALIRGALGDVLAVIWLAYLLAIIWPRRALACCWAALGIAFALEGLQALHLVPPEAPTVIRVMLGATFDPWDLVAYTVGFAGALALAQRLALRSALRSGAPGSR